MAEEGERQPMQNPAADPLVAHLRRCCLRVMGEKPGCGFFVAPQLLITCSHVVGPATPVGATLELRAWGSGGVADAADRGEGSRLPLQAEVLANEATDDIALLRLLNGGYPYVALDGEVRLGDQLVAIGFPQEGQRLELDQFTAEFEAEVPFADVSGKGPARVELKFKGGQVRHGFSGGPLLNRRTWRVIGVGAVTRDARSPM
ncbi:MAG: serine protease, partial [Cyanobium sp.]